MRLELAVSHEVSVELVAANPLKASVEPVKGAAGTFRLSIEQSFLAQLTQVELRAVIAHELGHVWIYTHHPYLQTEQLANQIALRVVSRESLDSVYGKVWPDAAGEGLPAALPGGAGGGARRAGSPELAFGAGLWPVLGSAREERPPGARFAHRVQQVDGEPRLLDVAERPDVPRRHDEFLFVVDGEEHQRGLRTDLA